MSKMPKQTHYWTTGRFSLDYVPTPEEHKVPLSPNLWLSSGHVDQTESPCLLSGYKKINGNSKMDNKTMYTKITPGERKEYSPDLEENSIVRRSIGNSTSTVGIGDIDNEDNAQVQFLPSDMKTIGRGVSVNRQEYELINFYNPRKASADLALLYFGRHTMATHSVTGRQPPRNPYNEPVKPKLPADKLSILLNHVLRKWERWSGRGERCKYVLDKKSGRLVPLTLNILRRAVMKRCYGCSAMRL